MKASSRLLMLAVAVAGPACGDGGNGPSGGGPGMVDLVLTTPYADDGGLLITVSGAPVRAVAGAGYELTSTAAGPAGVTLLVKGDIAGGPIARVEVPDRTRLKRYTVRVIQAASRGPGYRQRSPAAYQVTLAAP